MKVGGFEYWDSSVEQKNFSKSAYYDNTVATIEGGYVWKLTGNLYLNPWVAAHALIGGQRELNLVNEIFKPAAFSPEASIKLGRHF